MQTVGDLLTALKIVTQHIAHCDLTRRDRLNHLSAGKTRELGRLVAASIVKRPKTPLGEIVPELLHYRSRPAKNPLPWQSSYNALRRAGVGTWGDMAQLTTEQIFKTSSGGQYSDLIDIVAWFVEEALRSLQGRQRTERSMQHGSRQLGNPQVAAPNAAPVHVRSPRGQGHGVSKQLPDRPGYTGIGRHDDAVAHRIGEWAKRLLQLDRRNNLLYFKPGRSVVGITGVLPDQLAGRLLKSRRGLKFPYTPPAPSRRRGFAPQDDPDHTDIPPVQPGDITTDCEPGDLQRRLRNLQSKAREWEEEQGLKVLCIGIGFLNWVDEDGEQANSPLLLMPCNLERESLRDPFRLVRGDDDAFVNSTLSHRLAQLEIQLPEFESDSEEDESIKAYIDRIEGITRDRADWFVDSRIVVGAFAYSKLAMYQDLTRMQEQGVRSELTRLLAGAQVQGDGATPTGVSATPREADLVGGRLDDLLDLRDQYTVLPADFSQLRAIEEARQGRNLVIHGPPGTGKSQTIANLIATLLAEGKRVLFVSEKTAALDVVKQRLEECTLGVFCLDLHSDRVRKSVVYRQLSSALNDVREQPNASVPINELVARRDRLNRIVRLLHERREPLGKSVYEMHGLFARHREFPQFEAFDPPLASQLTFDWLLDAKRVAERIARRPEEFRSHDSSRWIPLRTDQASVQLADQIRADMRSVQSAIGTFRDEAESCSTWLGTPIQSVGDVQVMVRLLRLLAKAPAVPATWLAHDAVTRLRPLSRKQAKRQRERNLLEQMQAAWFGGSPASIDYRTVDSALELSPDEREAIEGVAGPGWSIALSKEPRKLLEQVGELVEALDLLTTGTKAIAEPLADSQLHTLAQLSQVAALAARILALEPVPQHWLTIPAIDELERELRDARLLVEQLRNDEGRLAESFDDALVERVDEEMLVRYRTDHQTMLGRFRRAYRHDQRTVRGQLKNPRTLSIGESLDAIELAVEVKQRRGQWNEMEARLRESLGVRFRGRETDWERVFSDLAVLRDILADFADWRRDSAVVRELLAAEAVGNRRHLLEPACRRLQYALNRYQHATGKIGYESLMASNLDVVKTENAARSALEPLSRVREAAGEIYTSLAKVPADYNELVQLVKDSVGLMAVIDEDERLAPALAMDFGNFFEPHKTDWASVSKALDWTAKFLDTANGWIGDTLENHATHPRGSEEYNGRVEALSAAVAEFTQNLGRLDQRFDVTATDWQSWTAPPFADLEEWSAELSEHAGDALMWVEYRDAVRELDEQLGTGSVTTLRSVTEQAEEVPGIVLRRICAAWLDELHGAEPELRGFSRIDHEDVRARFQQLDECYPFAVRQRVRDRVFAKYPDSHATSLQTGQLGILNGELSKRRRQMPVRKIIARIPNLLQTLKPCFLMSPLAVSQYLPAGLPARDHLEFDVVIFDEASQVLPEDALPAIDRARQVIVVGDRLQLPPTTFFRAGLGNDDDWDDNEEGDEDTFEGRESILDVMVGQVGAGIAERYLSVHYRSRCESLIRFSNHAFYENRLLTFPSPDPAVTSIRDVYLPHATYEAGGSRTNRNEAERVADIVFELMETQTAGEESIGVVAFSRPQANLIDQLIEERRWRKRHLDQWFSNDIPERFFVKNLENVQGDERDHMILSIGYGPTPAGKVPNRFGPINRDGGERRLNVAVTRARKSMTIVHSLCAEHITSEQPGARQLRRYLEYVRDPEGAFESEVTGTGEPESPFEEAVLEALRGLGHRVAAQVGVSGYRIDLAIRSEGNEGFDLGIECDGATYHSSPTARDRDWLRQQVLERLGWRIHRVWSTAWIRDPGNEIAAIEQALERARSGQAEPRRMPSDNNTGDKTKLLQNVPTVADTHTAVEASISAQQSPAPQPFFDEYRHFECASRVGDLLEVPPRVLETLVRDIISVEQPIHIDTVIDQVRTVYGFARAGKRIRTRLTQTVTQMVAAGTVCHEETDDEFLSLASNDGLCRPRRNADRKVGRVAPSEIDEGLLLVASRTYGAPKAEIIRETARQFGWNRTGKDIVRKLNERVEWLLEGDWLLPQGDMLVVSDNYLEESS